MFSLRKPHKTLKTNYVLKGTSIVRKRKGSFSEGTCWNQSQWNVARASREALESEHLRDAKMVQLELPAYKGGFVRGH